MIILIILIIILVCSLLLMLYNGNNNYTNNVKKDTPCCSITPKNQQQCYESKYRPCCPFDGSYKQCTNNFKHKIECQCDQNTLNLDICRKPTNEKCFHKNDLPDKPLESPLICKTRVNYYNPNTTIHDILK